MGAKNYKLKLILMTNNKKDSLTFSNVDRLDWAFLACIGNGMVTPVTAAAPEDFRGLLGTVATAVSLCVVEADPKEDLFVGWLEGP